MKAQWEYRGEHAQERFRREGMEIAVTGKLAGVIGTLLFVSAAIYVGNNFYSSICGMWNCVIIFTF